MDGGRDAKSTQDMHTKGRITMWQSPKETLEEAVPDLIISQWKHRGSKLILSGVEIEKQRDRSNGNTSQVRNRNDERAKLT